MDADFQYANDRSSNIEKCRFGGSIYLQFHRFNCVQLNAHPKTPLFGGVHGLVGYLSMIISHSQLEDDNRGGAHQWLRDLRDQENA